MKKLFLLTLLFLGAIFLFPQVSRAQDAAQLQKQIDELEKKLSDIKDQSKTLSGQIAYYDSQIALNKLKISQTESLVASISGKIDLLENNLQARAGLLQKMIVSTYTRGSLEPLRLLLSPGGFPRGISDIKYSQITQSYNRRLLHDTQLLQSNYGQQKLLVQSSQTKLKIQKQTLSTLRDDKNTLLKQTQNSEIVYQKLLAEAVAQRDSLRSFAQSRGGKLLPPQPSPDGWYFNQRDERWGLQCIGSTCNSSHPSQVWEVGCLITSVAMLQKKNGQDLTPTTIASNPAFFFQDLMLVPWPAQSGFRFTNYGRSFTTIDSELSAGRPVIVQIYMPGAQGGRHFLVLKSKSGSDYIMNDPWEGTDLKFRDYYSLSAIISVSTYTKT